MVGHMEAPEELRTASERFTNAINRAALAMVLRVRLGVDAAQPVTTKLIKNIKHKNKPRQWYQQNRDNKSGARSTY